MTQHSATKPDRHDRQAVNQRSVQPLVNTILLSAGHGHKPLAPEMTQNLKKIMTLIAFELSCFVIFTLWNVLHLRNWCRGAANPAVTSDQTESRFNARQGMVAQIRRSAYEMAQAARRWRRQHRAAPHRAHGARARRWDSTYHGMGSPIIGYPPQGIACNRGRPGPHGAREMSRRDAQCSPAALA